MELHHSRSSLPGRNRVKLSVRGGEIDCLLLIAGGDARLLGHNPNLKEVNKFRKRRVKLAVRYASSCSHSLHFAGANDRPVTKAIFVFECSLQNIT
jgi:hypothetical protein